MPQGHKVRLGDGSVIHLDRAQLRTWYQRGLINAESPIQAPGSSRWVRLAEILDLKPSTPPPKAVAPARLRRGRRSAPRVRGPLFVVLAAALLAGGAWVTAPWWRTLLFPGPEKPAAGPTLRPPAAPSTRARAVEAVTREAPHLSPALAEWLMEQSAADVLEPAEAFRRAYLLAGRGLASLTRAEASELGALNTAVYSSLAARERDRLGAYIERVRGRQPTSAAEDEEMSRLVKGAVLKLPVARRARLQALFEKAVMAGLQGAAVSAH